VSSIYGKGPRGKATRLHSLVVRSRGRCERCGSANGLQAAHIIPRRYAATRTDENNAWCLCAGCHMRLTEWSEDHMAFVDLTLGRPAYDALKQKALDPSFKPKDTFWLAECERLTALLEEAA
jgi:5-methylcytosine-specific restriction endonuclease McrA